MGMNSATSNLSFPSQQHPIKFANRSLRSCPTALASSYKTKPPLPHITKRSPKGTEPNKSPETTTEGGGERTNQELARVGPGRLVEALDGHPPAAVEDAAVDDVGRLLAVLRHDAVGGEPAGRRPELLQPELREARRRLPAAVPCAAIRGITKNRLVKQRFTQQSISAVGCAGRTRVRGREGRRFEAGGP